MKFFVLSLFILFGLVDAVHLNRSKRRKELAVYLAFLFPGLVWMALMLFQESMISIADVLEQWLGLASLVGHQ
ncbi:hypothetical protein HM1_0942 [Heliomicrobium modesticaldum Ice1]|uniref:Uncharacterized protein n=1 Tax=Heliobacterium modesticaldum (strain ATCC 51547 / Ice1) TaxID=498761 RepID=B0TA87_HELMI|nr:hypothetical protein [Heliomicrobium modesticaldum]ABZ83624.1 hypothetical protein HM1_0942 [Heliomicrobium modesticaldum Ice1]